jgi:hypothetical protein
MVDCLDARSLEALNSNNSSSPGQQHEILSPKLAGASAPIAALAHSDRLKIKR